MDINARVTILVDRDGAAIEIEDDDAAITFVKLEMSTDQFCSAIGRLSSCETLSCKVNGLDRVGKNHECKKFEFLIGDKNTAFDKRKEIAYDIAVKSCPEGWEPDKYFGSQDSFFTKGEELWGRVTIRRWVEK